MTPSLPLEKVLQNMDDGEKPSAESLCGEKPSGEKQSKGVRAFLHR